ncbi:hypothetical protein D5S17_04705 [Pseudonocardiaceae bacterium YIM PH 21723]|nr:hypothetical protein D5S17_04705 [Pseudonocardiaceae bacterium YIM PH 21723]
MIMLVIPVLLAATVLVTSSGAAVRSADSPSVLVLSASADRVVLSGVVAEGRAADQLLRVTREKSGTRVVTDALDRTGSANPALSDEKLARLLDMILAPDRGPAEEFTVLLRPESGSVLSGQAAPERSAEVEKVIRELLPATDLVNKVGPPAGSTQSVLAVTRFQDSINRMLQPGPGITFGLGEPGFAGHGATLASRLGRLLTIAPASSIELVGHSWAAESNGQNPAELAKARADRLRDELVFQGVNPAVITTRGIAEGGGAGHPTVDVKIK